MEWVIAALAVVAIALAAVAATGRGGGMPDLVDDRVAPELPDGPLDGADLQRVQFAVVPRGYAMDQVDALIDRLSHQLGGEAEPAPLELDQVEAEPTAATAATPEDVTVTPEDVTAATDDEPAGAVTYGIAPAPAVGYGAHVTEPEADPTPAEPDDPASGGTA